mgnify:CR=1 FL=1
MDLNGKKIFVAGATGLAGAGVIRGLLRRYPEVRVRGTHNRLEPFMADARLEYIKADLTRREDCATAVAGCDMAVLAAANTGGAGATRDDPAAQVTDNVVMDALLFQSIADAGIKRAVFVSSATVYQEREGAIAEDQLDMNLEPHAAHQGIGWAKRTAEKLAQFWHAKYGLAMVIARAANIFGPYARFDPKRANFIPALVRKAVDKMEPFEVWGNPAVTRDVIYVDDFADAICALLAAEALPWGVFNVGSGEPTTVGQVVQWVLAGAGHRPKQITYTESGPTTIPFRVLDCSRIQEAVGWKPALTVEDGVKRTIRWWMENRNWWRK